MEIINQAPKSPSIIERQKQEASAFVTERISSLINEKNISKLNAARQVYEEVKGRDYRQEQATAKLLELLEMQNEVDLRTQEIVETYPDMARVITNESGVANDDKYLVAA